MAFNLLTERWIPVLWSNGKPDRIGILAALAGAGRIRQIAASNPMDNVALLRFLLAILYWSRGNPNGQEEQQNLAADQRFPPDSFTKLEQHRDCFNLLGEGKRFYQNPNYARHIPEHTINYLIHEVPSGNNWWHFRHVTEGVDGLCLACCAMGLLRLPVFATSGGRGSTPSTGKSPGINSKPPLYVLPVGDSLADTLALSWHSCGIPLGTPTWETSTIALPQNGEVPLLAGLTWVPRSVWLADPDESKGLCASCGREDQLIRRCVYDGKGSSKTDGRVWRDPHVIYEGAKDGKAAALQTSNALDATDGAAGQWAGRMASIVRDSCRSAATTLWIVGFSTVQNDKYLEATERRIPCPRQFGQEQELITLLEQWEKEAIGLSRRIRAKSSKRKDVEIRPAVDSIRQSVESRVSAAAEDLFSGNASRAGPAARVQNVESLPAYS